MRKRVRNIIVVGIAFVLGFVLSNTIVPIPKDIGTASRMGRLELAIKDYFLKYHILPESLKELAEKHFVDEQLCYDLWGKPISYEITCDGQGVQLLSHGNPNINSREHFKSPIVCSFSVNSTMQQQCPKEHSYAMAMQILRSPCASSIFDQINECNDVVALRIIAFTARVAAWPMEAGPAINYDNRLDDISQVAMHRLFIINSDDAKEAIEYYKRLFPPDAADSLLFKEWEEEQSKRK